MVYFIVEIRVVAAAAAFVRTTHGQLKTNPGVRERHEAVQADKTRPLRPCHQTGEGAGQGGDSPLARQVRS